MTFWWKLGITAALLVLYGVAVWKIHSWYDASGQVKEMTREETATKDAMKASSQIDTSFSESIAKLHELELSANQQIEAAHETPAPANCSLNPRGVSILRAAIAANHSAR
ncbi:hypothetical protein [Fimbriiglobus ruber]|uniref:Uncharacterized protein n=1 Tax=Fimbriiglobus ruber TaxID=1908690 RepID=A0A225DY93_9BACT|nr:hypothetical protein [Fimbriiglobus ruber]OWK42219.1 hypothetical protein FRUB_04297 [Fimbriiglobus ruber]